MKTGKRSIFANRNSSIITTGITFAAFCSLISISILSITSSSAYATNLGSVNASVTVDSTCTMNATVTSAHTATLVNGTYSSADYPNGIGSTLIKTFCNDANGYAIYAVGYTNNELGNTVLKATGDLTASDDIVTGTATSGTVGNDVSNWAMKISAVDNIYAPTIANGFGSFSAIPSTYTTVAEYDSPTDTAEGTNIGSSINTTYAAYISNTQAPGTYTGQVKYVLVHPDYSNRNPYVMQNIAEWEDELLPEVQVTAIDNRDNTEYTVAKMKDGNIWMTQNLDLCIGCTGTAILTSENTDLNQYDTNGDGTGTTFAGYSVDGTTGVITWTPSGTTVTGMPATITNFAYTTEANNSVPDWVTSVDTPYMAEGQDVISYGRNNIYQTTSDGGVTTTALQKCINAGNSESLCKHNQYGNYYNFTAAVAMNDTSSYTTQYTVMPNSICPAGWRLPKGLTQTNDTTNISEFNNLFNNYSIAGGNDIEGDTNVGYATGGFNGLIGAPLFYARAGRITGQTFFYSSAVGSYWSSVVGGDNPAYYLHFSQSELKPAGKIRRGDGRALRCLHTPTMQNATKADLAMLMPNVGDTAELEDERDGTKYTIGKLADGNYWMLDNLALGSTSPMTLTNTDTNMTAASWTLPASSTSGFNETTGYTSAAINADYTNVEVNFAMEQTGTGKMGVFYNYCAASAGTYCMDSDSGSGNAEYDICPKGWRMPTGGENGEYLSLKNSYSSEGNFAVALRINLSGIYFGSTNSYQNERGDFWSSNIASVKHMYGMRARTTSIDATSGHSRDYAYSVRCIKQ